MKKILGFASVMIIFCIVLSSCSSTGDITQNHNEEQYSVDQGENSRIYDDIENDIEKENKWVSVVESGQTEDGGHIVCLIDESGNVCSDRYTHIGPFAENGLAQAEKENGREGYIDAYGNEVIPFRYDRAFDFGKNGLAIVLHDQVLEIINGEGRSVANIEYGIIESVCGTFASNGLALVMFGFDNYGYVDENGEFPISKRFYTALDFNDNGLALAKEKENGKYGYIGADGNFVIQPQFDNASLTFSENGYAWVVKNNKYGFIDSTGKTVIEPQFDRAGDFSENGLAWIEVNKKRGYIDESGAIIIPVQYDSAGDFKEGYASVSIDGKCGYIDNSGNIMIKPEFDMVTSFAGNGLAGVKSNGRYGFINKSGEFVIPLQSEWSLFFTSVFKYVKYQ